MRLKGIVLAVILSLASIMMPFSVYAAVQSTIVPTFSSTTSQWNGHLYVTNFSDGTNNQASSTLSFTLDDDYYGVIYFDGYGPSNQHIANYASVFIAGGYGEYRYSYYQNGVINITSVTINIVNVVKPGSSVDLSQIVTLLTAIESDTTAIDNVLDTTLAQIRLVLAELIESNGYLEDLTKIRQYDLEFYSIPIVYYMLSRYEESSIINTYNMKYPSFVLSTNQQIYGFYADKNRTYDFYFLISNNISDENKLFENFSFGTYASISYERTNYGNYVNMLTTYLWHVKLTYSNDYYGNRQIKYIGTNDIWYVPILFVDNRYIKNISTDFALQFGLSNQLLDDIHIIANGTTQSNSAASDLEQNNNQMADDMDDLATIESGYNQQFNNQLQSIDFTSPIQSNAGILPAANFVISIFNGLINNNPFSVLIIVVCILLIGKKVIGK